MVADPSSSESFQAPFQLGTANGGRWHAATVLRVLGRYDQSMSACEQVAVRADPAVAELCKQGIRGLTGDLPSAYAAISQMNSQGMPAEERAWPARSGARELGLGSALCAPLRVDRKRPGASPLEAVSLPTSRCETDDFLSLW